MLRTFLCNIESVVRDKERGKTDFGNQIFVGNIESLKPFRAAPTMDSGVTVPCDLRHLRRAQKVGVRCKRLLNAPAESFALRLAQSVQFCSAVQGTFPICICF